MKIGGQEIHEGIIARIQQIVDSNPSASRVRLSRRVSEELKWRSTNGRLMEVSCRVALLKLHRKGLICLPEAGVFGGKRKSRVEAEPIVEVAPSGGSLRDYQPVELIPIGSADSKVSRVWNDLMDRHHYLGSGPLCGAQLRYLIRSGKRGWMGGLAFSAAAWSVEARDHWIGWDRQRREENLNRVIGNSRFLILPQLRVPDLASHVLGLAMRRVSKDWRGRYGYEPLLVETFIEEGRFKGTCYLAANWREVGRTQGRGRQDRGHQGRLPVKRVLVYPLSAQARERLCEGRTARVVAGVRRVAGDWAEQEFGMAELKDKRLNERLLILARDMYDRPQANIPQACGTRAKTKAAYRFFEHEDTTMDRILTSHYEETLGRVGKEKVVLAVQDTTSLNYSRHPATEGLGPISSKGEGVVGLEVHDTMAFNLEGTPLGLLDVQSWARDPDEMGKKHRRYELPIEDKESHKWFVSFGKVAEAQNRCPGTTLVSVGDREADIYELFQMALRDPCGPKLLVRASRDRLLSDGQGHLWEVLGKKAADGVQVIGVPRQGKRPARQTHLEVRFGQVRLKPPKRKSQLPALSIWAVLAEEIGASEGVEPLRWMLLTTAHVDDFEQATERLGWYARRWGIEVYHRTLKSGCKIEQRQMGSADRIESCLAIDMVVAWRIFHLTKLGRETPNVPCTVFFEDAEWKALWTYVRQDPIPPATPPTLREAIRMVASLGGFLGRKGDGEPGTKSIWLGLQRLDDLTGMWKYMAERYAPHLMMPPVSSNVGYG